MFKELNLEDIENVEIKANKFLDEGVALISKNSNYNINKVKSLRNEIELEFKNKGYPMQIELNEIENINIHKKIYNLFANKELKEFLDNLSLKLNGSPVTIFPSIHIMRNYLSGPHFGMHGWHSDSLGERPYDFCFKRLKSKNYLFGKISIALQKNTKIGGNIDIAKATFKNYGQIANRQIIANQLQAKYLRIFKKSFPLSIKRFDSWFTDLFALITNPKSINPNPYDIVAFHSQLFHRGTPPSPKGWQEILKSNHSAVINKEGLSKNINLKKKNKFIIYAHFGNLIGVESYLYDRSRRIYNWEKNQNEKRCWLKQYKLDLFSDIYPESNKLFDKALKKI